MSAHRAKRWARRMVRMMRGGAPLAKSHQRASKWQQAALVAQQLNCPTQRTLWVTDRKAWRLEGIYQRVRCYIPQVAIATIATEVLHNQKMHT
jgi:hypothetical protein